MSWCSSSPRSWRALQGRPREASTKNGRHRVDGAPRQSTGLPLRSREPLRLIAGRCRAWYEVGLKARVGRVGGWYEMGLGLV